ncbi:major allergen Pru ar 1-like protein [Tanacetum coccineum]
MGIVTYTDEHTSSVPPARIFKASIVDSHNLMPKILPDAIKSIDFIKGDGGAGSIKQINFAGGSVKHQIDELDEKTLTYKYTLIEGMGISDKIEKVSYDIKFEASSDGGTISKMTTTIHTHGDFEIKEEELKAGKEKGGDLFLVNDFLANGRLDKYIYDDPELTFTWEKRFKVIKDVARGLLTKLCEHRSNSSTTEVLDTSGYLAPELTRTDLLNQRRCLMGSLWWNGCGITRLKRQFLSTAHYEVGCKDLEEEIPFPEGLAPPCEASEKGSHGWLF